MFNIIFTIYIAFFGILWFCFINKIFKKYNSKKKVSFNKNVKVFYFNKVENKERHWYSKNDYINFHKQHINNL